jgi:hypothetical protein
MSIVSLIRHYSFHFLHFVLDLCHFDSFMSCEHGYCINVECFMCWQLWDLCDSYNIWNFAFSSSLARSLSCRYVCFVSHSTSKETKYF